jgi:hypothetical protein
METPNDRATKIARLVFDAGDLGDDMLNKVLLLLTPEERNEASVMFHSTIALIDGFISNEDGNQKE